MRQSKNVDTGDLGKRAGAHMLALSRAFSQSAPNSYRTPLSGVLLNRRNRLQSTSRHQDLR
jgi:hypothetical protein